jgi:multidrug efflux pump subunit AcrB/ABC-type multidrug transport system ATPase subunit
VSARSAFRSAAALAVARPVTTLMLFIGLGLVGVLSYRSLPVQLMPNLAFPQVFVQAYLPGASPETLEEDVLRPLEGALAQVGDVAEISSSAGAGSATVTLSFDRAVDLDFASVKVQQAVAAARDDLPEQAFVTVQRFDTSSFSNFVMVLSFRGDTDLVALREIAEETVVPVLSGVDGVVQVAVQGGASPQVAVFVDPERARARGLSMVDVRQALSDVTRPLQAVGVVEDRAHRMPVTLDGRASLLSDVAGAPVGRPPQGRATTPVRLSHVADIQPMLGSSVERYRVNGQTSVGLYVFKDPQSNLLDVAHRLRQRIDELDAGPLADLVVAPHLSVDFDAGEVVEKNLDELYEQAAVGAVLAFLVLLVFLGQVRPIVAVAAAVPASLLVACGLFKAADMTLDLLSLLGLALSVGMLMDNSIVVLEAIAVRRARGDDVFTAARAGASSVQRAVVASTLTTIVVFVPLYLVETDWAPLFKELALAVSFPLLASLLVAVTLVPVVAAHVLGPTRRDVRVRLPGPFGLPRPGWWRSAYSAVLRLALRNPIPTMLAFFGTVVAVLPFSFLIVVFAAGQRPSEDRVEVQARLPPGASVEAMDEVARQIEEIGRGLPEVDEVRAGVRENQADVSIVFRDAEDRRRPLDMERVREVVKAQAGEIAERTRAEVRVDPPREGEGSGGGGEDVFGAAGTRETVRVSGPGGQELWDLARRVKEQLEQVPGIVAVVTDLEATRPTLEIRPDRQALARHGLSTWELMSVVWATRREGEPARYPFKLGDDDVDLVLWVEGGDDRTLEEVRSFPLVSAAGARIPLSAVASITTGHEPPLLRRFQRERTVTITYGFSREALASGDATTAARRGVDRAVEELTRPAGHHVDVAHADEELAASWSILWLALLLVYVVLAIAFESVVLPLLVMLCVPLAIVGVVPVLVLTGTGFTPLVLLALVVLLGIVVNHGILFVDRSQALVAAGAARPAAVLRAAHERLRPIMMTTCTTVVGMLPLAVDRGGEQEIWPPFARAVIGGLLASTLLSLVFIPAGVLAFGMIGDLLKRLGTALSLLVVAASAGALWWLYFDAEIVANALMRFLVAPPFVLAMLALARGVQALVRGERPEDVVGEGRVEVRARNVRKIYGGWPRPFREAQAPSRWEALARRAGLRPADIDTPAAARYRLTWICGAVGLLVYLHLLARTTWGQFLLALPVPLLVDLGLASLPRAWGGTFAWPPPGRASRSWRVLQALALWAYLFLRHRPRHPGDITVLVLAALLLGAWAVFHVATAGGALGLVRRRVAPAPSVALDGVSLDLENGLYGLLGPNGAGKSTLMRLVVNLYRASRGTITVNGREVGAHAASLQPRIGYLPQFFGVPPRLSAREYLHHHALLAGKTDRAERRRLVEGVLEQVGLADRADEPLGGYSGGMRQRVGIARTLLNVPRIVVVDEPTVGLDPRERVRFRNLLAELARTRIVLLSTHVVEDIGSSCREVFVLDRGLLLFRGTPQELAARAEGRAWMADVPEAQVSAFTDRHAVVSTTRLDGGLVRVRAVGQPAEGATPVPPTLEDAYLLLLGRRSREVADAA